MQVYKILDTCTMEKVLKINCGRYFINDPSGPAAPIISKGNHSLNHGGLKNRLRHKIKKIALRRTIRKLLRSRKNRRSTSKPKSCSRPISPRKVSQEIKTFHSIKIYYWKRWWYLILINNSKEETRNIYQCLFISKLK